LHEAILPNDDITPRLVHRHGSGGGIRISEDQALRVDDGRAQGGACIAVYAKDIAEAKASNATDAGRGKGYPLLFTTEP
jgi:ATP-dependent Clp protease adaptor protein ClpS